MKRRQPDRPDPDDMFSDTRMTFGEHIEDLRSHLLRAIYGFLIGFIIAFPLGNPVLTYISAPVKEQLKQFNQRYDDAKGKELTELLKGGELTNLPTIKIKLDVNVDPIVALAVDAFRKRMDLPPEPVQARPVLEKTQTGIESLLAALEIDDLVDWKKVDNTHYVQLYGKVANPLDYAEGMLKMNRILRPAMLTTLSVQEAFMVWFKVIMVTGLVIASPWVFYQIWMFIAVGLYPSEKRLVNVYLPFSIALFLVGVFTCEFFVIPKAIEAMLWFNEYLGFQPDLRLSEWLGFAIFMPIVFGVSFQTPLVMYFLEKIGLFTVDSYKGKRRIAWFLLAIFAAIITPSTDAFSMLFLWIPMCLLYELGIWMCVYSPRAPEDEWATSDSEEMVEV